MKIKYFFDSNGDSYVPCSPEDTEASPFGPTGISRPALHLPRYEAAKEAGIVSQVGPWAVVLDEFETLNEQRAKSAALLDMISSGTVEVV